MSPADARAVLLMHAVETRLPAEQSSAPAWSAADAAWAGDAARREVGESAGPEAYAVARARRVVGRLAERDARWQAVADAAGRTAPAVPVAWRLLALAVGGAALAIGLAADALAGSRRIDLLAPPLLALMLWNLAVYALLVLAAWQGRRQPSSASGLVRWLAEGVGRLHASAARGDALRQRWRADVLRAEAPLHGPCAAAVLHGAAAALAIGLLAGLYGRGLVLDYRAGWDSTFLDAAQVRALVCTVLCPAAALLGWPVPDTAGIAALRWAAGGTGAPAAVWIHLYALTVSAVVVLPRLLLAALAWGQARRASKALSLPLGSADEGYWAAMRADTSGGPAQRVRVLAYSHQPTASDLAALPAALSATLQRPTALAGPPVPVPMGGEDAVAPLLQGDPGDAVVLLYTLAATPERETHGAFARAVAAALPRGVALHLAVDRGAYRQRLASLPEAAGRLAQRAQAWEAMCAALQLPAPRFIDLASTAAAAAAAAAAAPARPA